MRRKLLTAFCILILSVTSVHAQSVAYKTFMKSVTNGEWEFFGDKVVSLKEGESGNVTFSLTSNKQYKIYCLPEASSVTDVDAWVYDGNENLLGKDVTSDRMATITLDIFQAREIKVTVRNTKSTETKFAGACRVLVTSSLLKSTPEITTAIPNKVNQTNTLLCTAVFKKGTDAYSLWMGAGWNAFVAKYNELKTDRQQLVDLVTYEENGIRLFSGVWRESTTKTEIVNGLEWEAFAQQWEKYAQSNFRLADIETYMYKGKRVYAGIFKEGNDGYYLWKGVTWSGIEAKAKELTGMRLTDITSYVEDGQRLYIGVWRESTENFYTETGLSWSQLEQLNNRLSSKNLQLADLDSYVENGNIRYTALWKQGAEPAQLFTGTRADFLKKWEDAGSKSLRLTRLTY